MNVANMKLQYVKTYSAFFFRLQIWTEFQLHIQFQFLIVCSHKKTHLMHENQWPFKCIIYIFIRRICNAASLDLSPPKLEITVPQFIAGKKNTI
jgi:hypothetical protein